MAESGAEVRTTTSGYLQYIRYDRLVRLAAAENAVIQLPNRPGHFLTEGQVVATVWPAEAAGRVAEDFALVQRAFEKIRQAGLGQPAVMIRELDALAQILDRVQDPERRRVVLEQAAMIERQVAQSIPEEADREDVLRRCAVFRNMEDASGFLIALGGASQ